jgi:hypothetical protein
MHRLERRLRLVEKPARVGRGLLLDHVSPEELARGKKILKAAMESSDWSTYYSDLEAHAPTVLAAFIEAGQISPAMKQKEKQKCT